MKQDSTPVAWRKSTYSNGQGDCVEIGTGNLDIVPVRDSKDPEGPTLAFPAAAFASFVAAIKAGQFTTS